MQGAASPPAFHAEQYSEQQKSPQQPQSYSHVPSTNSNNNSSHMYPNNNNNSPNINNHNNNNNNNNSSGGVLNNSNGNYFSDHSSASNSDTVRVRPGNHYCIDDATNNNNNQNQNQNPSNPNSQMNAQHQQQQQMQQQMQQHYVSPLITSFPNIIGPALPCRYRPRKPIGRGAYSTVWSLTNNETNQVVVGKLADLAVMTEANRNFARSEAANIRACDHPNIIKLIETFERGDKLLHILEYADAGDLYNQVELRARNNAQNTSRQPVFYQENEILVILSQLFLAVQYIHDRRILHRDLKTPNVMLMKHGLIKLGDFGFSRQYEESVSTNVGNTFCGTPYYLAPELWQRQPYSYKAEIWSLGVIAYELMMLQKPFPAHDFNDLMLRVCREKSYTPIPPERYSKPLIHLVEQMLRVDPEKRPNIKQILASPVMQQKGLPLLKINVRRLRNLDPSVCARLVAEVEHTLGQTTSSSSGFEDGNVNSSSSRGGAGSNTDSSVSATAAAAAAVVNAQQQQQQQQQQHTPSSSLPPSLTHQQQQQQQQYQQPLGSPHVAPQGAAAPAALILQHPHQHHPSSPPPPQGGYSSTTTVEATSSSKGKRK